MPADSAANEMVVAGLTLSAVCAIGNALTDIGRKKLSAKNIDSALQIALVCLLEGILGMAYLTSIGELGIPGKEFWMPAVLSAVMQAVAKTLQTEAYSISELSMVAPFNAALPVMQFLVSMIILREDAIPPVKVLGVFVITAGAIALTRAKQAPRDPAAVPKKGDRMIGPLPLGAVFVLANCFICSLTTKLDQMATMAADKWTYLAFGKLMVGMWAAVGSNIWATNAAPAEAVKENKPKKLGLSTILGRTDVLGMLFAVACAEGFYMLCYYGAITKIPKVYVVAIKKGGSLLLAASFGIVVFGESAEGKVLPVLAIVTGVVMLAL